MINQKGLEAAALEIFCTDFPSARNNDLWLTKPESTRELYCSFAKAAITAYLPHHESELLEALEGIAKYHYTPESYENALDKAKQALSNYNKGE